MSGSFLQNLLNPATSSPPYAARASTRRAPTFVSPGPHQHHFNLDYATVRDNFITDSEHSSSSSSEESDNNDEFESLSDSSSTASEMPPSTRHNTAAAAAARRQSVVDLTDSPATQPPPSSRRRKRSTSDDVTASSSSSRRAPKRAKPSTRLVEAIDLADDDDENPSAEEELLRAQQQETVRQQQAEVDAGPQKIGSRQCIICMEGYTNATATSCGHFYCHECLFQALVAGERNSETQKGACPVCRKPLTRKITKSKKDVIPVNFMKKATFEKNRRQMKQG